MRLTQVALGVWTATAATWATLTTVVVADDGACLVVDPGITVQEVTALAAEIGSRGWRCVAGFATHPHWDHVLWASALGDAHRTWSQCGWVAKPATQRHPREPNSAASAVTSWTVIPGSTTRHAPSSATTTVVRAAQVAAVAVHTPGATCVSLIARRDTWTLRSPRHQRPRHQRPRPPAPRDRCACAPGPRSGARRRAGRWRSARRRRSRRRGAVVPCVAWPRRVSAARAVVRGQGRGADDPGRVAQSGRHDAGPQVEQGQELRVLLAHPAADHDQVGPDQVLDHPEVPLQTLRPLFPVQVVTLPRGVGGAELG